MTQEEMLKNLRDIYPSTQVALRMANEDIEILVKIHRNDPFDDDLTRFHPYRIVNPTENTIVSALNAEDALAAIRDTGLTSADIDRGLDDSTIDMLMIMEAKGDMVKERYDDAIVARASTKHASITAQYEAVKDDPEKFQEFLIKLSLGEDMQPALSVVPDNEEDDNA